MELRCNSYSSFKHVVFDGEPFSLHTVLETNFIHLIGESSLFLQVPGVVERFSKEMFTMSSSLWIPVSPAGMASKMIASGVPTRCVRYDKAVA